jgi:hypothetical protein
MKYDLLTAKEYSPTAVYYEEADSLEYLREAVPSIYRRIDPMLTMVLSLENRTIIGFKLKGFKNFYLRHLTKKFGKDCPDFIEMVDVIQEVTSTMGSTLFEERQRLAYEDALKMAAADNVQVTDLPRIA